MSTTPDPTFQNIKNHNCANCNMQYQYPSAMQPTRFFCQKCGTQYAKEKINWENKGKTHPIFRSVSLQLGMKAYLEGEHFMVVGMAQLTNAKKDIWSEYLLVSDAGTRLFLSESYGNWIALKETSLSLKNSETYHTVQDEAGNSHTLRRFIGYHSRLHQLSGFFDYAITKDARCWEYVNAPMHLIIEHREGSTIFLGHYLSRKEVYNAFEAEVYLPTAYTIGASQPFLRGLNVAKFTEILLATGLFIFILNFFANGFAPKKELYSKEIFVTDSTCNQMIISPSFEMTARTAPIHINMHAEVENSWMEYGITLINEKTQEERDVDIGVEFYSGTSYYDGQPEYWREGNKSGNFIICSVEAGTYHLEIQPSKGSYSHFNSSITFTGNKGVYTNMIFACTFLILSIAAMTFYSFYFEQRRWANSNHKS